jgi:hypothetical protein
MENRDGLRSFFVVITSVPGAALAATLDQRALELALFVDVNRQNESPGLTEAFKGGQ